MATDFRAPPVPPPQVDLRKRPLLLRVTVEDVDASWRERGVFVTAFRCFLVTAVDGRVYRDAVALCFDRLRGAYISTDWISALDAVVDGAELRAAILRLVDSSELQAMASSALLESEFG